MGTMVWGAYSLSAFGGIVVVRTANENISNDLNVVP